LHPERYHGHGRKPPFFEGWYFKMIDHSEQHRYAVIPGIFLSADPAQQHAFVQVFDGSTGQTTFHRYPAGEFQAAADAFDLRVGPNRFTLDEISLQIDHPERSVHGVVRFEGLTPWPVTLTAPGVMGWYAWVPFMECYHGILSLDHAIQGTLVVDGNTVELSGGRGYIEKDWGPSFPAAWVWFQSNHFQQPGTSITASIAVIPWLGGAFRGQIIGLWHEHTLYRFATYTGARVEKLEVGEQSIEWVVRDRRHRLAMRAHRAQTGLLKGPSKSDMGVRVFETLQAEIAVRLTALEGRTERLIFEGRGRNGGLEVGGDIPRLLSMR
jgi:hypothetical protein